MGRNPSGVLVPLSAAHQAALPTEVRAAARGWHPGSLFASLGLVTPAGVAERELAALGWRSRGRVEGDGLPACLGCDAGDLRQGARVWAPEPAAAVLGGGWPRPAAAEPLLADLPVALADLLRRALRQGDAVAVGDLLQTTLEAPPAARTLARAAALRASSASAAAALLELLRADRAVGVSPLAQAALGALLWDPWRGPWPLDPELEHRLAAAVLEGETSVAPDACPPPVRAALDALQGAGPAPAWLPPRGAALRAALDGAPGDAPLPRPAGGWLGFVLADRERPAALRRARLRRGTEVACAAWFPELAPLDALVARALADGAWAPVEERLRELDQDAPRWTAPERARARTALEAASADPRAAATLLALRAAEGEDVRDAARELLGRGGAETEALAFAVLAAADETPGDVDPGDPVGLARLCRFYAWRGPRGGEPPQALVDALLDVGPAGFALSETARGLEPASVAGALGAALPLDLALALLTDAAGEETLLVRARPDGSWDALYRGRSAVLRPLSGELPAARLAPEPGLAETPYAVDDVAPLGRVAVCHRVPGLPLGACDAAWSAVTPALAALHAAGFALGQDPLSALRQVGEGWAFAGLDLAGSLGDLAAAQRADVERLRARARTRGLEPPETLAELAPALAALAPAAPLPAWRELRDLALDVYLAAEPFGAAELGSTLEPDASREVVLGLDAELHASGLGRLRRWTDASAWSRRRCSVAELGARRATLPSGDVLGVVEHPTWSPLLVLVDVSGSLGGAGVTQAILAANRLLTGVAPRRLVAAVAYAQDAVLSGLLAPAPRPALDLACLDRVGARVTRAAAGWELAARELARAGYSPADAEVVWLSDFVAGGDAPTEFARVLRVRVAGAVPANAACPHALEAAGELPAALIAALEPDPGDAHYALDPPGRWFAWGAAGLEPGPLGPRASLVPASGSLAWVAPAHAKLRALLPDGEREVPFVGGAPDADLLAAVREVSQ
ncbi:MAG: hypothetical protein R3F62_23670 [Planctomycetota bacterium]